MQTLTFDDEQVRILKAQIQRRGRAFIERTIGAATTPNDPARGKEAAKRMLTRALSQKNRKGISKENFEMIANALDFSPDALAELLTISLPRFNPQKVLVSRSRGRMISVATAWKLPPQHRDKIAECDFEKLPLEMNLAATALYSIWQIACANEPYAEEPPVKPYNRGHLFLTRADPAHSQFEATEDDLAKVIKSYCEKARSPGSDELLWNDADDLRAGNLFESVISPETALFYQELCLFPFSLTKSRQAVYGCLPWARQTKIGVLAHKSHFASLERSSNPYFSSLEPKFDDQRFRETDEVGQHWLAQIIVRNSKSRICLVEGDIMGSVLIEALRKDKTPSSREALDALPLRQRKLTPVEPEKSADRFFTSDKASLVPDNLYVFDPWKAATIHNEITSQVRYADYRSVICAHGVNVPTGLGFSLNLLPMLIIDDHWKNFVRFAHKQYESKYTELKSIGIEMLSDDEMRKMGCF